MLSQPLHHCLWQPLSELPHSLKSIVQVKLPVSPLPIRILHGPGTHCPDYKQALYLKGIYSRHFLDIHKPFHHKRHCPCSDGGRGTGSRARGKPPARHGSRDVDAGRGDVRPPALSMDDDKSPRKDPRYAELTDEQIPLTESLKDTINRLLPYYNDVIMKSFEKYDQVLVVAHGNSLRGVVKELRQMSNSEIIEFNIPTAVPYIFEFDENMKLVNCYFLGDQEEIARKMQSVANQGKAK